VTVWRWLTTDPAGQFVLGVLGNLVASALCFFTGGRWLWKRHGHHVTAHLERVKALHDQHLKERADENPRD
jgi:hypothetical protein